MIIGGGGIAAVLLVLYLHKRSAAQVSQSNATVQQASIPTASPISAQPDLGAYYSGTIPSAVGSSQSPSDSANSGSTTTGGGFDIGSLLAPMVAGTVQNNASQIIANQHTADSAILAGINVAPGGSVSVTHTSTGTTVTNSAPSNSVDSLLTAEYQNTLGRAPDAAGFAWWEHAFTVDPTLTPEKLHQAFVNSDEYKKAHPNG